MTTFKDATQTEIESAMKNAETAFHQLKKISSEKRSLFLDSIAEEIELLGNELIQTAMRETHLPEARLLSERGRTTGQLRIFAQLIREGSWVEASIDTALPERTPIPKPDIRKMLIPIGPVVVFGASNFPFAYSTAGGDTASALAAGCPVIVKAHPAHAETSEMVAGAIQKAIRKSNMPEGIFQHLHGAGFEVGKSLVMHSTIKAVGFTGSFAGGKALFDLANRRGVPIPVFAEMGSVNPVFILPETMAENGSKISAALANSVTLGMGQFCTNPGLMFVVEHENLSGFMNLLGSELKKSVPAEMLHDGISLNYHKKKNEVLSINGVILEAQSEQIVSPKEGFPTLASVSGDLFLSNPVLHQEVFGPFSLIVKCKSVEQMISISENLEGQLTASVWGNESDLKNHSELVESISEIAGRIVINGAPTGVEVCPSINHGGPFPATTDSRFTSVGISAVKRFARPMCYQNFPVNLLPDELKNSNPKKIWRMVNNDWTKSGIN